MTLIIRPLRKHVDRNGVPNYDGAGCYIGQTEASAPRSTDLWYYDIDGRPAGKIPFIKALRSVTSLGLKEAKDAADGLERGEAAQIEADLKAATEALSLWVSVEAVVIVSRYTEARLPEEFVRLNQEFRALFDAFDPKQPEAYAAYHHGLYGFGIKSVAWKRGRADSNSLGMRAFDACCRIAHSSSDENISKGQRSAFRFLEAVADDNYRSGDSLERAKANAGAGLLTTMDQLLRPEKWGRMMDGDGEPALPSVAEFIVQEAAKRLLDVKEPAS